MSMSMREGGHVPLRDDTWVCRSVAALDANANKMRAAAVLVILLMSVNPLVLVTLRAYTSPSLPTTFCEDFVLDVDGSAKCSIDTDNTGLFLKEILVSGKGCMGELSSSLWTPPVISVWAANSYDLSKAGIDWYLVTSPEQAGLNTLYPTADSEWSWVIKSNKKKPTSSALGSVSSSPGSLNLVACLEKNPDVSMYTRGMKVTDFDFRSTCTNIATWCGSICNYASNVSMPTCDLEDHKIIGTTWTEKYKLVCDSTSSSRRLQMPVDDFHVEEDLDGYVSRLLKKSKSKKTTTDDASKTDDATDDYSKSDYAYATKKFTNVTWSFGDNENCSYVWTGVTEDNTNYSITSIDAYDIYAIAFTVFFDVLVIFSFLPLLPRNRNRPHHASYAKRMLQFTYGMHEAKLIKLLAAGNIRALVFLTARVTEPEFEKQMESTCNTMKQLADRLIQGGMNAPLKLIVKVIDEERTAGAFEDVVFDEKVGMNYFRTPLLKLLERISVDPTCKWFPDSVAKVSRPLPGGHYRRYTRMISTISFEVHYMRRGWRPERKRTFMENFFGFGQKEGLRKGDTVVFDNGQGKESGIGVIHQVSVFGGITILKEAASSGNEIEYEEAPVMSTKPCVMKMIEGAGKGAALGDAYDILRHAILRDLRLSRADLETNSGNMLVCVLDARHHIVAQSYFWNTLVGPWWIEEQSGFDEKLQYVQVSQNLKPPQHFFLGQQNKMWYSFLSTLLSAVGAVTSSGSGSITKIPLDNTPYEHFKQAALALKSNTEDYLQSIIMLSRGGTGAYVCNYDYTTAKGKDTMLSAYLRWEGGNFAVCSKGIILRQAFIGTIWVFLFCALIMSPVAVLLVYLSWTYAIYAAVLETIFFILVILLFTTVSISSVIAHTMTVQIMALRSILNPLMGVAGAFFLFSLPLITSIAGHVPLQLHGVTFPWTLLIRAFVSTVVQGIMYSGVYVTEQIRNDVMKEVLEKKLNDTNVDASRARMATTDVSDIGNSVVNARWVSAELNAEQPGDLDLDRDLEIDIGKAWCDAGLEYMLQALYQMNQLSLQPGKGLMSCLRGVTEIVSREFFSIDASGWVSGKVERIVIGIPIATEAFMVLALFPYIHSVSAFLSFVLLAWMALTAAFVWVEEIFAPNLSGYLADPQVKKAVQAVIVYGHLLAWFVYAGLA